MRLMSFALTTDQIRDRTKTVTRRLKWHHARAGQSIRAVKKAMGFRKGEKPETLCTIKLVNVRGEMLNAMECEGPKHAPDRGCYGCEEARKEGFPHLTGTQFVEMFCSNMKCEPTQTITRIEFSYLENGMTATEAPKKRPRKKLPTPTPEQQKALVESKKGKGDSAGPGKTEKSQEAIANGEAAPKPNGKKAVAPGKQTRIEGTYQKAPKEVTDLANEYANALHERQALQNAENTLRDKLKDSMKKHGIVEVETDDSYVTFEHEEKEKIKVRMKKDEDG